LKLIIASVLVFSLIIIFLFALFPSEISVSQAVQIKSSPEKIIKKISDLRNWKSWNLLLANPDSGRSNTRRDRIDSGYLSSGALSVELLKADGDSVITEWQHVGKSFKGIFVIRQIDGRVFLEWTLDFHLKWYPWEKLAGMFYDKQLSPPMEKSLENLRGELESP
jgi:hypothetical protein